MLVIENATVNKGAGGLQKLPLKFALFLLKDKDGVINLDVPVRGDLNDPEINFGKLIWTTFKNLIIKVATAPFRFLAGVVGGDSKDLEAIYYEYGDTTLTENRKKQIDMLLDLEQKKPGLKIEMVYYNDVEKEKEEIALDEAGKLFFRKTGKTPDEEKNSFEEFLLDETGSETLDVLSASLKIVTPVMVDSLASFYAQTRIMNITDYLKLKSDSTNILTSIGAPDAPENVDRKPVFLMKYSLEEE
jgi:hypothetical protein